MQSFMSLGDCSQETREESGYKGVFAEKKKTPKKPMQSKVSQKGKDKYCILMPIYRIQKNGTEEFISGQQWKNRQREKIYGHGERWREGEMSGKNNMETYITICKIDS